MVMVSSAPLTRDKSELSALGKMPQEICTILLPTSKLVSGIVYEIAASPVLPVLKILLRPVTL